MTNHDNDMTVENDDDFVEEVVIEWLMGNCEPDTRDPILEALKDAGWPSYGWVVSGWSATELDLMAVPSLGSFMPLPAGGFAYFVADKDSLADVVISAADWCHQCVVLDLETLF